MNAIEKKKAKICPIGLHSIEIGIAKSFPNSNAKYKTAKNDKKERNI